MRLLVYGDSNSFGTAPTRALGVEAVHPRGARWVDHLAAALPGAEVIVEGQPGRTTVHDDPIEGAHRNGLTVLPAILESHRPIDLLLICLGTNDFKARFGLTAQDVALGIGRLVRLALASGVVGRCLVIAPPPPYPAGDFTRMFEGAESRTEGFAGEVRRFGTEAGAEVFDAGAHIACDPLDGIHWSAEAHQTLAAALSNFIKETFS